MNKYLNDKSQQIVCYAMIAIDFDVDDNQNG